MEKKAICLLSGGIDSCVSAYIAKKEGYKIYALSFNYSQKHKKEIQCAITIAKTLQTEDHIIFKIPFKDFNTSSLISNKLKNLTILYLFLHPNW